MLTDLWKMIIPNPVELNKKIRLFFEPNPLEQIKTYLGELATPENLRKTETALIDEDALRTTLCFFDLFGLINQKNFDLLCAKPNIVPHLSDILTRLHDKVLLESWHCMILLQSSELQLAEINRQIQTQTWETFSTADALKLFSPRTMEYTAPIPADTAVITIPSTPRSIDSPKIISDKKSSSETLPMDDVAPLSPSLPPPASLAPLAPIERMFPTFVLNAAQEVTTEAQKSATPLPLLRPLLVPLMSSSSLPPTLPDRNLSLFSVTPPPLDPTVPEITPCSTPAYEETSMIPIRQAFPLLSVILQDRTSPSSKSSVSSSSSSSSPSEESKTLLEKEGFELVNIEKLSCKI